jgi:hypothetical protein
MSLALVAASAYAGTVFDVSGTFDYGGLVNNEQSSITGTLTIDTVNGDITDANVTIAANGQFEETSTALNFTAISSQGTVGSSDNYYYVDFSPVNEYSLDLDIYLGAGANLAGYTGGNLCSDTQSCYDGAESFYGIDPNLNNGVLSAEDVSGAPEPSSALLLLGGAAAMTALSQRKRRV